MWLVWFPINLLPHQSELNGSHSDGSHEICTGRWKLWTVILHGVGLDARKLLYSCVSVYIFYNGCMYICCACKTVFYTAVGKKIHKHRHTKSEMSYKSRMSQIGMDYYYYTWKRIHSNMCCFTSAPFMDKYENASRRTNLSSGSFLPLLVSSLASSTTCVLAKLVQFPIIKWHFIVDTTKGVKTNDRSKATDCYFRIHTQTNATKCNFSSFCCVVLLLSSLCWLLV